MEGTTWSVVSELGLVAQPESDQVLVYGSADPAPNPAELILTQLTAGQLGLPWRFFIYLHGKNLGGTGQEFNIPEVFYFENIIPEDMNIRDLAEVIWNLRREPVIVAHRPDGRPVRATKKVNDIPDLTLSQLYKMGGWLGGAAIHYFLRKYAEEHSEILYICPFQMKGLVYQIYQGVGRGLFVLTPFVRIAPPKAPAGWEPLTWREWLALPASARRRARRIIRRELKNFSRRLEPKRIEIPWEWWFLR